MEPSQVSLFPEAAPSPTLRAIADAVRAAGSDALPGAIRLADHARYQDIQVRSALAEAKGMFFRWTLNPYRGCTHGCEYCYARKYQRHLELGAGDDFSSIILVKRNLPDVLTRELARPSWQRETVAIGTATDAYQPIEGRYAITRRCLEILIEADTPFSIVTKGPLVVRDIDLLQRASRRAGARVIVSLPSVDADACARLEPGVAPPAQRLRAVRTLIDAGIDAGVLMAPLIPGITTSRSAVERTLHAIRDAKAPFVGADIARLDPGVREHFFGFLEREYPALLEGYRRLYPGARARPAYAPAVRALVQELAQAT